MTTTHISIPKTPEVSDATKFGVTVLIAFFGSFILWSVLFPIDSAAIAPGKVTVHSNRKTIQHLEGGIIKELLVHDSKLVQKGDLLIRLDDTQARASLDLVQGQLIELLAAETRLLSERDKLDKIKFSKELLKRSKNPKVKKIMKSQENIFNTNKSALAGQNKILDQRIGQLHKEIESLEAQVTSESRQLELVEEEIVAVKYLEARKLIEKPRLLALQREEARILGNRGEHQGLIARAEQRIGETQTQIISLTNNAHKEVLDQLRETQRDLGDLLEREKAALDILTRIDIIAPQSGKVVGLSKHTIGGVINPGEEVLHIIPLHDELVIEARIKPIDIDIVHEGLIAKITFTAFKQRHIPSIEGTVTRISADIFEDPATKTSFYRARISISKDEMKKLGDLKLYQGMPAQVMIIIARQTPFSYFITPLTDSFNRAFRED